MGRLSECRRRPRLGRRGPVARSTLIVAALVLLFCAVGASGSAVTAVQHSLGVTEAGELSIEFYLGGQSNDIDVEVIFNGGPTLSFALTVEPTSGIASGSLFLGESNSCREYFYKFELDGEQHRYPPHEGIRTYEGSGICTVPFHPTQLWLVIIADIMISLAYFSIPMQLLYFTVRMRLPTTNTASFQLVLSLFICFITLCGLTHFLSIPTHWFHSSTAQTIHIASKISTAVVSMLTSVVLIRIIPKALGLPIRAHQLTLDLDRRILRDNLMQQQYKLLGVLREMSFNIRRTLDSEVICRKTSMEVCRTLRMETCIILVPEALAGGSTSVSLSSKYVARRVLRSSGAPAHSMLAQNELEVAAHGGASSSSEELLYFESDDEGDGADAGGSAVADTDARVPLMRVGRRKKEQRAAAGSSSASASATAARGSVNSDDLYTVTDQGVQPVTVSMNDELIAEILQSESAMLLDQRMGSWRLMGHRPPPDTDSATHLIARRVRLSEQVFGVLLTEGSADMPATVLLNLIDDVGSQTEMALSQARLVEVADARQKQLTEQNEALKRAREEADNAAHRYQFLAVMSHEIRTPMYAVVAMADVLRTTDVSEEQREMIDTIRRSGDHLVTIINDILDFSKYEFGQVALESRPFSLRVCIEHMIDVVSYSPRLNAIHTSAHVRLNYFIHPMVPRYVSGDLTRLSQVIGNLLSNSVKFTDEGDIILIVLPSMQPTKSGTVRLEFIVRDTGVGIPNDRVPFLFDKYTQADLSTTRRHGGTGLGLAIAQSIVHQMGGSIGVTSTVGAGSTFFFDIVFTQADSLDTDPPVLLDDAPDELLHASYCCLCKMLLVDGAPLNMRATWEALHMYNIPSRGFTNVADALDMARLMASDTWPLPNTGLLPSFLGAELLAVLGDSIPPARVAALRLNTASPAPPPPPQVRRGSMSQADGPPSAISSPSQTALSAPPPAMIALDHEHWHCAVLEWRALTSDAGQLAAAYEIAKLMPIVVVKTRWDMDSPDTVSRDESPTTAMASIARGAGGGSQPIVSGSIALPELPGRGRVVVPFVVRPGRLRTLWKAISHAHEEWNRGGAHAGAAVHEQAGGPLANEASVLLGGKNAFLPQAQPRPSARAATPTSPVSPPIESADGTARSINVLVVDDNSINQMVTSKLLKKLGHSVGVASSGAEALAKLAAPGNRFDLVLMDMMMPEMDGIETTRRLRASGNAHANVRVVALTANSSETDRDLCMSAGMDGFMAKPVKLNGLANCIANNGER